MTQHSTDRDHQQIRIYTSNSAMRKPMELIMGLFADTFCQQSRDLARRMFVRNISAQYRQTILGYLWIVLPPLVITFLWVFLKSQKVVSVGETGIPYAIYALSGNLLWQAFLVAMETPINRLEKEKQILTKLNFSREALLLACIYEALLVGFIQLFILIPILLLFFQFAIGPTFLLAPFGLFLLVLLGFTFGMVLTPFGLLFKDIGRVISILGRIWFFVTPIVYPVPKEFPAALINYINPVTPMLVTARNLITGQPIELRIPFFLVTIGMFMLLFFALVLYRLAMPHLIERMSS